jgi:hypothetical protein
LRDRRVEAASAAGSDVAVPKPPTAAAVVADSFRKSRRGRGDGVFGLEAMGDRSG